jgi:hypothetical protein
MKKTTKNNTGVPVVEAVTSTADPKKSEDEIELEQLKYLLAELLQRGINDIGTLARVKDTLERKIQSH